MITAKIVPIECKGFDKPNYFVYSIYGYIGEEKVVHNLANWTDKPSNGEVKEFQDKWNSEAWQSKNGMDKFLNKITPRRLRLLSSTK